MLKIVYKTDEFYDEEKNLFIEPKETILLLEHSLVSISKWEAIFEKPFISDAPKSIFETTTYILECMLTNKVDIHKLNNNIIEMVNDYISKSATATTIKKQGGKSREVITSELIYFWMIQHNIPISCEKWHLNRLLMLINICAIKNNAKDKSKINQNDKVSRAQLNAARKQQMKSKG